MMTNDSKDQGREAFEAWWESLPGATGVEADKDYEADVKGWALMSWEAALTTSASALARDEVGELCARCNCWVRPSDDCNLCRSADDAKPVGEAVSVALSDERIIDIWCNTPTTRFGGEVEDQEIIDFARVLLDASPAASTATVSDAASVALTDELPGATAALRDLLSAKDLPNEQGALARVRGENMQKAWEHARALLAASQADTASGAQDERGAFVDEIFKRYAPAWYSDHPEVCRTLARELFARAASSATAPLTSDSEANQTLPQHAMPAWRDVVRERRRQIGVEGWTPEHDDGHDAGSLAAAGSAYAIAAADKLHPYSQGDADFYRQPPDAWPWHFKWWKPKDPRTALVKAGALILAEIERLDRAQSTNGEQS